MKRCILFLILVALPAVAYEKDFLTPDEVAQIRETAPDPNARLVLYIQFAKQRVDRIQQLMDSGKAGRSVLVHDLLDDYTKIIEAIDTVSDDALKRKIDITKGMADVAAGEKEMLATLEKIRDSEPKDIARYEFSLKNAIDTTQDSSDLSAEDMSKRSADVLAKEKKEKQDIESMMAKPEADERKAQAQKESADQKPKRKAPTLRRPGEPPLDQQQQPPSK